MVVAGLAARPAGRTCGLPLAPRRRPLQYLGVAARAHEEEGSSVCLATPGQIMELSDPANHPARVEVAEYEQLRTGGNE